MGEEGRASISLPEELVARILVRVPFPYIFKARLLSKSWLARFQPISPEHVHDEEQKRLIISFQEQVVEWSSTNWKTFSPVFFRKDNFIAYDRTSNHWQRMPWLSFLPKMRWVSWWRLEGALLLVAEDYREMDGIETSRLYVTNILTRSWKQLPPRPLIKKSSSWPQSWLIPMSSQTYKVVIFYDDIKTGSTSMLAEMYDSKLGAWSNASYIPEDPTPCWKSNWAYFNGFLYRLICRDGDGMPSKVVSFSVKDEVFDLLQMPVCDIFSRSYDVGLVVCNGYLLVIKYLAESVIVQKIDLGSRRFLEVTRGPPSMLDFGRPLGHPASDGDWIFFMKIGPTRGEVLDRVLAYNMLQDEWSDVPIPSCVREPYNSQSRCLSFFRQSCDPRPWLIRSSIVYSNGRIKVSEDEYEWATSSFQPGLNPFLAVVRDKSVIPGQTCSARH